MRKALGLPPADFDKKRLPTKTINGGKLYRVHRATNGPDYFGKNGDNRFDDPVGAYGVLYIGHSAANAFSETFLRDPGNLAIDQAEIDQRRISIAVPKKLVLVPCYGARLARIGITAEIGTCDYAISQAWSQAFHNHPSKPDGIYWAGRHDNATFSIALFERAKNKLKWQKPTPISDAMLAVCVKHWGIALT